eukprot:scaffold5009_cov103-Isochrysis_galbana.AAC.8
MDPTVTVTVCDPTQIGLWEIGCPLGCAVVGVREICFKRFQWCQGHLGFLLRGSCAAVMESWSCWRETRRETPERINYV